MQLNYSHDFNLAMSVEGNLQAYNQLNNELYNHFQLYSSFCFDISYKSIL